MGIVHLAEARGPGGFEKLVVVKELKPELTEDPVYTAMFLDEARLSRSLTEERDAFRAMVKKRRASSATTQPQVWLPSTELHTRFSGPPALPTKAARPLTRASLSRWLGPAAVVAISLSIAIFGFTHRSESPSARGTPVTTVDRTPHTVESVINVSVDTSASREASQTAAESAVAAVIEAEPATSSRVPAAVLRESLPPNPYDRVE